MHGLVARDHHARGDVADQTGEEDHDVDHRDRHHDVQRVPAGEVLQYVVSHKGDNARVVLVRVDDRGAEPLQLATLRERPGIPRVPKDVGDVRYRTRNHPASCYDRHRRLVIGKDRADFAKQRGNRRFEIRIQTERADISSARVFAAA